MSDFHPLPAALLNATLAHLTRFAPFSEMAREHLEWMIAHLSLAYFPKDAVLLDPSQGPVPFFSVIKQGSVVGEQVAGRAENEGANWQLTEGECFPLGALLANRPVANVYRAAEDTFCYQLPAAQFAELLQRSAIFHDFCTRRIAHLLERSKQAIQAQYTQAAIAQQPLSTLLSSVIRREPVTCASTEAIATALAKMHAENVGSMVIVAGARPIGIFTLHDLLARVALAKQDLSAPIAAVMTREPVMLSGHASAYEAALLMARHGIRHVLVVEGERFLGVVSEKDLFSVQRVGLTQISINIRTAKSIAELAQANQEIHALAHSMLAQGVGAEQLTQIITTLNDLLTQRLIDLTAPKYDLADIPYCWLALGSEGRMEQTLATDQDNGIIFTAEAGAHETARTKLLAFAQAVNNALDQCGFPLCQGGVMASNPKWCLTSEEWHNTFSLWIDQGDPEALLNSAIFFDFRALYGEEKLAQDLRAWLASKAAANPRFLHQMAGNALRNRPPLGVVRDFVLAAGGEYDHTIDLKLNGATPFVDAARIYSLAAGDTHTNTLARLRAAGAALKMSPEEIAAWAEALLFIQLLRLRNQHLSHAVGRDMHNHVNPDTLNELERRILKETFRQARKLQTRLALDYGL
ncbi:MAG: CBS domain-containing protein [Burkholderiales bacterium]|nr:CBS domain-containing protein [Burkholderiales bacterium]